MVSVLNLCLPLIAQVLWILSGLSSAYPGGAPDVACESMFPTGHATSGQTAGPPFKIVLSKSAYLPGETIGGKKLKFHSGVMEIHVICKVLI